MKNNSYKIYPLLFIPILALIYYTTFFMMSQTTDSNYGYKWPVVFFITVQFGILWIIAQVSLNKLVKKGWHMNLKLFILSVFAMVIVNNVLYYGIKFTLLTLYQLDFPLFTYFTLGLTTLEGFLKGTLLISMLFSLNFFKRWRLENEENERLKRNELELQNRALRNQLNPHFLFNNLNTLSGLIQGGSSLKR
jgi:sensor histidine kinase YesM